MWHPLAAYGTSKKIGMGKGKDGKKYKSAPESVLQRERKRWIRKWCRALGKKSRPALAYVE